MSKEERDVKKSYVRLALGLVLSGVLVYFLFRSVSWSEVWQHVRAFSGWAVGTSVCIVLLSVPLRTWQWYWLLGRAEGLTWPKVFRAICLGHLGNTFLPMRGGELLKVGVLTKSAKLPVERVLTSVVLCRVQDLPIIGCIFLFFLAQVDLSAVEARLGYASGSLTDWMPTKIPPLYVIAAIALGVLIVMTVAWVLWRYRERMGMALQGEGTIYTLLRWIAARLGQVLGAVKTAGHPARFAGALLSALFCWVLFTLASVPLLLSMGLDMGASLHAALIITGATTFFQLLPSAPTAVGTFHFGCALALSWVLPELDSAQALAFAVVLHGVGTFAPVLPGLLLIPGLSRR
ncbi:MAG: flippase-like domain-containing protein [Candidatus Hydrogenedentes bacterium]|nr:flippase-like domain-containing protein [Candidatus Hydrogenedentota bacterium]